MDFEALDFVPIPIVVLERTKDDTFEYVSINKAAMIFSGLSLAQVAGKTPREVFPGRSGEQLASRQEEAAQAGRVTNYTYPIRVPRGEVWIETSLVPVRGPTGSIEHLVATMQDRTEERSLQEQRAQSDAQLKSMESEIEDYISMAAHDLRSPMRHVEEIASMLREEFVDHGDGKLDLIEMLQDIAIKANELIQEVLNVAQSSTLRVEQNVINLEQFAMDIFAMLDPQDVHDLKVDPVAVETDTIALQIALRNLLDNAIKHAGTKRISVHLTFVGEDDGMLTFEVCDNGGGFDDPAVAFLDGGELRNESGYGLLGVKRMVQSRGGTIAAENLGDEKGARVRFSLPGHELPPEALELVNVIPASL